MPKRFIVVEVNGQYYEIERPYGCKQFMVMASWNEFGTVERVWAEDADRPPIHPVADQQTEEDET